MEEDRGLNVEIHPLVLLNISQHFTRVRAQRQSGSDPISAVGVTGGLLGQTSTHSIEIRDSFDIPTRKTCEDAPPMLDIPYLNGKLEHLQAVTELEIVGWYSTGPSIPTEHDRQQTMLINEIKDASLFLKVNPFQDETPVCLFEFEAGGGLTQRTFTMETDDEERIGMDVLAGEGTSGHGFGAATRLYSKVRILAKYLEDVSKGELEGDPDILRQAERIFSFLPQSPDSTLCDHEKDSEMIETLTNITVGVQKLHGLVQKADMISKKSGSVQRVRGLHI